jgi:hypothetical protein
LDKSCSSLIQLSSALIYINYGASGQGDQQ